MKSTAASAPGRRCRPRPETASAETTWSRPLTPGVSAPQANVYHASTAAGDSRAIKIYKTSILLFKDRDKYVSGEFRWPGRVVRGG